MKLWKNIINFDFIFRLHKPNLAMKIYYWAPFLSNIATVSSVVKSIESIKVYNKKNLEISIIDSVGEWDQIKEKVKDIGVIKLYKKSLIEKLPKGGFLKSRFTQLFIFIYSFFKLLNLLKKMSLII